MVNLDKYIQNGVSKSTLNKYPGVVAWCEYIHPTEPYFIVDYIHEAEEKHAGKDDLFFDEVDGWMSISCITNSYTLNKLNKILDR